MRALQSLPPLAIAAIIVAVLSCPTVLADSDSNLDNNTPPARAGRHGTGKHSQSTEQTHSSGPRKIVGHCTIVEGPGNPFSGPCVDTILILNDGQGNELTRTRTNGTGQFEFDVAAPSEMHIASGSRFYQVLSVTPPSQSGDPFELKLQQK